MNTIPSIAVPVGKFVTETEEWCGEGRTESQFETVRKIVESEDFDFACEPNPFVGAVRESLVLTYYTKDGTLHVKRIDATGKINYSGSA